jgi:hypothetical protein
MESFHESQNLVALFSSQNFIDLKFKGWYCLPLFWRFIKERRDGVNPVRNFSGAFAAPKWLWPRRRGIISIGKKVRP